MAADGPLLEHRDLDAGLAQLPLGKLGHRATTCCAWALAETHNLEAVASAGLEECTAIGAVQVGRAHHTRLLVGTVRDEEFTKVACLRSKRRSTLVLTTTRP